MARNLTIIDAGDLRGIMTELIESGELVSITVNNGKSSSGVIVSERTSTKDVVQLLRDGQVDMIIPISAICSIQRLGEG